MKPDSLAVVNVNMPAGALPWQILAILLVGFFACGLYAIRKIGGLKGYLSEPPFPTHAATVVAGILGFLGMCVVAISRAALGMIWPDGYGEIVALVGGALGIAGLWGVGKRATSAERDYAKAAGAATAGPASSGVTVQGDANITTERPVPVPAAGVRPRNPEVVAGLERIADLQRASITAPDSEPSD